MTGEDKKRKPYQHDSEAIKVVLRFLDRKQGAVNREYWGECSSATLPQSVDLRGDKKENKLITSYDCQAITVSFKRKMYKKAYTCKVVVLIAIPLTSPSLLLFKSFLFSRTLRMKTKSSAKP